MATNVPGNRWDRLPVDRIGAWTPTRRLTVVIPHFQGPTALARTLAALSIQTYPAALTEIVVVDDGSDPPLPTADELVAALPPADREVPALSVLHLPDRGFGLARARHTGALAADGDILVFLDHDMLPAIDHLEAHARWHHVCDHAVTLGAREHVAMDVTPGARPTPDEVTGAIRAGGLDAILPEFARSRPVWLERHLARSHQLTSDDDELFRVVTGGNLGVRRERYLDVGGFDPSFTQWGSEDTDLGHRLFTAGAVLVPEPRARCLHQGDTAGLEPHERRSLQEQRARLSQTVAHPHFRRNAPGRTFTVPSIVVDVEVGRATHDAVIATVESVLASDISDLEVVVRVPADHPDHVLLDRELRGDHRVRRGTRRTHRFSPYRVALPAGTIADPGALRALVSSVGPGRIDAGVVRATDVEVDFEVTLRVARAIGRARWVTADPEPSDAAVIDHFGVVECCAAEVGFRWEPDVTLDTLRVVARPTPDASATPSQPATPGSRAGSATTDRRAAAAVEPPAPTGAGPTRGAAARPATAATADEHDRHDPDDHTHGRDALPHLRALHLGGADRFGALLTHERLTAATWRDQLRAGADLVLVEPPADSAGWDPLDGELAMLLRAAGELSIPTVRIHPVRRDALAPGTAALELVETIGDGADRLRPSVDLTALHPRGWRRSTPDAVSVALGRRPDVDAARLLATIDPHPVLLRPPALLFEGEGRPGVHERTIPTAHDLGVALRRAGVLLDAAGWRRGMDDRWQGWCAALACGTPVVALDDGPLPDLVPPGVEVVGAAEIADAVHQLLVDPDRRERRGIVGRRWAMTSADRRTALIAILDAIGVPVPRPPRTSVLLATQRPHLLEHALDAVARQDLPDVDVGLVLHGTAFDGVDVPDRGVPIAGVVRAPASWNLGDCLNAALDRADGELVTKMDDDDHYGPSHLTDLHLAWRHSGADIVGKRVEFIHLVERDVTIRRSPSRPERDRPHVGGPTLFAARETLRRFGFLRVANRVDSTLYERVLAAGGRIYGTHSRDLVLARHGADHGHAWDIEVATLLAQSTTSRPGLDLGFASSDPRDAS